MYGNPNKIMARYSDGVVVEVFLPIKRLISDGQGKTGQSKLPPVTWTSKRSFSQQRLVGLSHLQFASRGHPKS